jgi:hypothetical protein
VRRTEPAGTTESPVSGSLDVGGVSGVPSTPKAVDSKDTSSTSGAGDTLTRLLLLVLGGALLLGVSGAAGLYVTRHRSDE